MENLGCLENGHPNIEESWENRMYTISNVLLDVDKGILANNLNEDYFLYRIVYFINENGIGKKYYVDTLYGNLRRSLENIIRENLTTTNSIVVAAVTTLKDGECISLLSKSYPFSLDGYFQQINGEYKGRNGIARYGRYAVR